MKIKMALVCCAFFCGLLNHLSAQGIVVTGKVTDRATGDPLQGATIFVKGTSAATSTDSSGNFRLPVSRVGATLSASYLGSGSQNYTVNRSGVVNFQLDVKATSMNEVVVVGYGTQRRKDITGSVASVKGDVFKDQPITNPVAALQGRIAGVNVVESSGAPDAAPSIVIRGLASFNQPAPLFIVDGVRVADISNINVQDIASIDVLKDAASAAIYGSAAAGGVLVLTTR